MNFINKQCLALTAAVAAVAALSPSGAMAREEAFPANTPSIIVTGPGTYRLPSSGASSLSIPAPHTGHAIRIASDASWLTASMSAGGIEVNAKPNPDAASRNAVLTVTNSRGESVKLTVTQPADNLTAEASDGIVYVVPSSATGGNPQPGAGLENSIDGDINTIYHSSWSGFVTGEEPVLTYLFEGGTPLKSIRYVPRTSGTNGNWGKVEVSARFKPTGRYVHIESMDHDFEMRSEPGIITVPAELADTTFYGIRIKVMTGASDNGGGRMFASCAELQFVAQSENDAIKNDMGLFADPLCTTLKPSVSQQAVDAMRDPFLKSLAQRMLDGTYSSAGRVSESPTLRDLATLANEFNAPNKRYDQVQGATGITMTRGRYVVIVDGIPEHLGNTELRVIGWTVPEGMTFRSESFQLRNGINVIDRATDWDGLAYISNYDEEGYQNGTGSTIRAHFVGAPVNGILTPDMTNEQIKAALDGATYTTIDIMGQRVHSVWEVDALKRYAADQWVRYINTLDIIIAWEHRLLGLEKYGRIPTNKTLAYVNYNYYMYQGGFGVTFKYDTQYRTCSPDNIMRSDDDVLWGLSHEWGHQHQMTPYFCWTGMAEVSNNIFSAYNVLHMGYPVGDVSWRGRFPSRKWLETAPRIFLDDEYDRSVAPPADGENKTANSDGMVLSLRDVTKWVQPVDQVYGYCPELVEFARSQASLPTLRKDDPSRAVNAIEAYSGSNGELILAPWVMLQYYFGEKNVENRKSEDYFPDLYPDFFESLRQCDAEEGSTVEKTDGVDKYELLVSAFNGNKNGKRDVFRSMHPESVWTTRGYLPSDRTLYWDNNSAPAILNAIRKMSRLTRYNLFDYFQRWGVITVAAIEQGDYGIQHYALTQEMYDEFRADMKALEDAGVVRPLPQGMVETISYSKYPAFTTPEIPNDRPLRPTDY